MKRVVGIGGIFFKADDPEKLAAWYKKHLGFDVQGGGVVVFQEGTILNRNDNRTLSGRRSKRRRIISSRAKGHS